MEVNKIYFIILKIILKIRILKKNFFYKEDVFY